MYRSYTNSYINNSLLLTKLDSRSKAFPRFRYRIQTVGRMMKASFFWWGVECLGKHYTYENYNSAIFYNDARLNADWLSANISRNTGHFYVKEESLPLIFLKWKT